MDFVSFLKESVSETERLSIGRDKSEYTYRSISTKVNCDSFSNHILCVREFRERESLEREIVRGKKARNDDKDFQGERERER